MRISPKKSEVQKIREKSVWHRWFAWFPVNLASKHCVDSDYRWLETVARKGVHSSNRPKYGSTEERWLEFEYGSLDNCKYEQKQVEPFSNPPSF